MWEMSGARMRAIVDKRALRTPSLVTNGMSSVWIAIGGIIEDQTFYRSVCHPKHVLMHQLSQPLTFVLPTTECPPRST